MDETQTTTIEQGKHGLVYLTDAANRGVFIAAPNADRAKELLDVARDALKTGVQSIPLHVVHDYASGLRVTVPSPEWMTPAQRNETIKRLRGHLAQRVLS